MGDTSRRQAQAGPSFTQYLAAPLWSLPPFGPMVLRADVGFPGDQLTDVTNYLQTIFF